MHGITNRYYFGDCWMTFIIPHMSVDWAVPSGHARILGPKCMTQDIAAESVAEEILYLTGKAIMENDDDIFIACVALPLLMETINGQRVLVSNDEIRQSLTGVRQYMKENDFVDLVRTVVSAEFLDTNTIGSTHVCKMIHREKRAIRSPFPVYSVFRRYGTSWKLTSCIYAILDSPEHNSALLPGRLLGETAT